MGMRAKAKSTARVRSKEKAALKTTVLKVIHALGLKLKVAA